MTRFVFSICTLLVGFLFQLFFGRYISAHNVTPHLLMVLVLAIGFSCGPILGETLGFIWGLLTDSMGIHLFGLHGFMLALIGFIAGMLRRRVASERPTAQMVIVLIGTVFYALGVAAMQTLFEEGPGRVNFLSTVLATVFNVAIAVPVFLITEWWIQFWRLEREHI